MVPPSPPSLETQIVFHVIPVNLAGGKGISFPCAFSPSLPMPLTLLPHSFFLIYSLKERRWNEFKWKNRLRSPAFVPFFIAPGQVSYEKGGVVVKTEAIQLRLLLLRQQTKLFLWCDKWPQWQDDSYELVNVPRMFQSSEHVWHCSMLCWVTIYTAEPLMPNFKSSLCFVNYWQIAMQFSQDASDAKRGNHSTWKSMRGKWSSAAFK